MYLDKQNAIAVGDSGTIIKSGNYGFNWMPINSNTSEKLNDITISDSGKIIIAGDKGTVLLSSLNSEKWEKVQIDSNLNLNAVKITPGFTLAVGDSGVIVKSSDGGHSWETMKSNIAQNLYDIEIFKDTVYVLGNNLFKSIDGGLTWGELKNFYRSRSMQFLNSLNGYIQATGTGSYNWNDVFWATSDGGLTWNDKGFISPTYIVGDFEVLKDSSVIIVGGAGNIFYSKDGKDNYWSLYHITTNWLNSIDVYDAQNGLIVGDGGAILKTHDIILQADEEIINQVDFNIFQNYPNPFNPSTKIKYEIPEESKVSIRIYNILGKEAEVLFNGIQKPGIYEAVWNAVEYSSGIYFYVFQAGQKRLSGKMILMK